MGCISVTTKDGKMETLIGAAMEAGFTHAAPLKAETLRFLPEVREMCNADRCHHYNTNWMCPPACGTLEECAARAVGFKEGIIVQSVGDVEDSFDIEAMQRIERSTRSASIISQPARASYPRILSLGTGSVTSASLQLSRGPVSLSRQSDLLDGSQRLVGE